MPHKFSSTIESFIIVILVYSTGSHHNLLEHGAVVNNNGYNHHHHHHPHLHQHHPGGQIVPPPTVIPKVEEWNGVTSYGVTPPTQVTSVPMNNQMEKVSPNASDVTTLHPNTTSEEVR